MKKSRKILAVGALAVVSCAALAGCGETNLWSADFTKEASEIFSVYSEGAEKTQDNTIILSPLGEGSSRYSASTYFGETDKNYDWQEGGMNVSYTVKIGEMAEGDFSVWSLALNETDGKYLTELPTFFVGTEDGIKFIYNFTGVENDYATLVSDETAVAIEEGEYTVKYMLSVNKDEQLEVEVCLQDEGGRKVYSSEKETFTVIEPELHEGKNYTNETIVKEEMVKGLRYLWLTRTSVDVEVLALNITK